MGGFAWVTLATNDSYSLGALVLAHSLKQSGTAHQLVVLVSPGVTNVMRQKLATVFNLVQEVNILDSKDEANLRLLKRPELGITFTKLHCWRLTQYDKCVFLDADTLILKNCDDLFEREEFSAAPDVGWPDCFNSGVFVYKPAIETYEKLIQFALDHGSFDGGDQGLLNLYFSDWAHKDISKHLPFIYNMCSTACYSYLPAFKYYGDNVKIVHFIGATKPWLQYFDTETKQVHPTNDMMHLKSILQSWWDIFCSLIHPNLTTDMGGLAGAFAQLTLGSPRSPTQTALEDQLRRQGWEVGNVDYLGRDSFNNIWGKICQTLATPPQDKKEEIPSAPPTPTEKVASPPASSQETVKLQEVKPKEEPILETKVTEQQKPQKLAPEVIEKPLESKVETSKPETPINISDTTKPVEQPLQQETKKPEMTVEPSLPPKPVEDVQPVKSEEIAQPVQVSSIIEDILKPASPVPQATELAAPPQPLQEISKVLEEAIKATECLISPSKQVQTPVPAQPQAPVPAQPQTPIPAQPQTPVPVKPQTPVGLIEKDLKTDISALPELPPSPEKVKPLEEINVELSKPIEEPLKTNEPIIMPETSKPVEQVSAQIQPEEAVSVERKVDDKNQKQDAVEIPTPVEEISKQEELKTEVIPKTLDEIPQDAQLAEAVSKLVEEAPIDIPAEVSKATEVPKLDESKKDQQDVQKQEGKSGKKGGKGDGKGQKKNGEQACKMPEKGKVECQKGKEPQKPKPNDSQKGKDTKEAKPNEGQKGKGGKQPEHKGKEAKPSECQKEKAAKPVECQKSKECKDSTKPLDSDKEKDPKPSEEQKPKEEKPIEVPKEEAKPVESPKPDEPETETKGKEVEKQQKSKKNKNHKGPKTPETPPATKPETPATKPEKSPPKTEAPVSKPDTPPAEVKNQEAEPQKLEGKKCQKKCKKECPKEGCEEKSCPKEVEVPKTPDVIEATPPMSPVATKPVEPIEAATEKPKEEKLLPTKAEIPATPPPASSTEQAPTPPPRKGNSGGKKTKGKK